MKYPFNKSFRQYDVWMLWDAGTFQFSNPLQTLSLIIPSTQED